MVDYAAAAACGCGVALDSFVGNIERLGNFFAGGARRGIPAFGNSGVAAYGGRTGSAGHGNVDRSGDAQTVWRSSGDGACARDAALDFRGSVPAGIWRVLGAADRGEVWRERSDRVADGDTHGGWR